MKNKKGFTLIELIVVIAILGILALFLVPSFMGYARDAKVQVIKANVKTGQDAYMYAWTKHEDEKNEETQKKLIKQEVCENLGSVECVFFIGSSNPDTGSNEPIEVVTKYPAYHFSIGSTQNLEESTITYYIDKDNYCAYMYAGRVGTDDYRPAAWICKVNGTFSYEVVK